MYLDYDTAPAQIKARLIKAANLSPNDRSKLYVVQCLEKKGLITNSKYDGFLYQKKGKNNRNSPVFFDKIGFKQKEQEKLEFTKSPKAWVNGANGANSTHNGVNGGANGVNNDANSNVSYNQAPQAPQAPQSYGNYDHMPDTVTNAVAKHNAQAQAQAQNTAQELDEIPF